MKLVFIDTETTDLIDENPNAEIIEYAGATWDDGAISDQFHRFVMPKHGCSEGAAKVNGYTPEGWKSKGAREFCAADRLNLCNRLDGMLIAGSNPAFDMVMIKAECARLELAPPSWSHRKLDLNSLGYPLWAEGKVPKTSLVTLAEFFGIEHEAHTAMGDVLASIKVWEALYDLYCYRPSVMREALVEIADQAATDGDAALEEYARNASEGVET